MAPLLGIYYLLIVYRMVCLCACPCYQGEKPIDGVTDLNPEGLTAANGKWAQELATSLQSSGLSCRVLEDGPFRAAMLEKLIWYVRWWC